MDRVNQIMPVCTLRSFGQSKLRHQNWIQSCKCTGLEYTFHHAGCKYLRKRTKNGHYSCIEVKDPISKGPQKNVQYSNRDRKHSKTVGYAKNVHYSTREKKDSLIDGYLTKGIIPKERKQIPSQREMHNKRVLYSYRKIKNSTRKRSLKQKLFL